MPATDDSATVNTESTNAYAATAALPTSEGLSTETPSEQGNAEASQSSSDSETPRVRSRRDTSAQPATAEASNELTASIEAGDEYVTIRTDAASTVTVTVDGQAVSISGSNGVYTFKRPSSGGTVVATVTDASGKTVTKQLNVSPSTVNGVIKPTDSSLTISNKFDSTGITTDKEAPYVVKNAGVEFNKVNADGSISLTGTSWTRLAGGWAKDKKYPFGAHMIMNFQNPTFYENIEKITIKPTLQGVAQGIY